MSSSKMVNFRIQQWQDALRTVNDSIDHGSFDAEGYIQVFKELAYKVTRDELSRDVMGMALEKYYFAPQGMGGNITINVISNGRYCAPTISDGMNLTHVITGVEVDIDGVPICPLMQIQYPEDTEYGMCRLVGYIQHIHAYLKLHRQGEVS